MENGNQSWLIRLETLQADDDCGGKARNLAELTRLAIRVPSGAAVSARAFIAVLSSNNVHERIKQLLHLEEQADLKAISQQAQELVLNCEIPATLEAEISEFARYGNTYAVRSSGGSEDGLKHSWAGQFETFLNVSSSDIPTYIRRCWASLVSFRSLSYAKKAAQDPLKSGMGVVIQEFVNCTVAGTAFTKHPLTSESDVIVIEAAFGLGDALVSGKITPDTYTVRKRDGYIVDKEISRQQLCVRGAMKGGTAVSEVPKERQAVEKLTPPQLARISNIALQIENYFGSPQDIEFGFKDDELFIFQTRPITA